jgi:2-polyprenyl-3-methyl-5-hydroxy-6-metoxy-1,4-benzoquinol methylase
LNIVSSKKIKKCICCGSSNLNMLLNLNNQPLANSYHNNTKKLEEYPLGVNLCGDCFHIQLTDVVNPDLLFKDYLYVSGTSETLRENFEWFSDFVLEYNPKSDNVLDIACNDGSQLDCFKSKGIETYGIDPAENLYELSSKNHNIICDYFNENSYHQVFDNIIAQNVFAHNLDAKKFLDDCCEIMHSESYLFIQTSQAEMILNNQFDTIYHEHISFFNVNSFNELVKRTKLNLVDVIKTPVHGISYLFVLSKKDMNKNKIKNIIDVEKMRGLQSQDTYEKYKKNVLNITRDFTYQIQSAREDGYTIIGYGAAAKGMTFLNFTNEKLDYIIDDNPLKQNLYTPGTNIEIKSIELLEQYDTDGKILFVPLAWNFYDEIKTRILKVRDNKNDRFLRYFPSVKVEK